MRKIFIVFLVILQIATAYGQSRQNRAKAPVDADTLAKLKSYVVANPNDLNGHEKFIRYLGADSPEVAAQYEIWVKQFPKSSIVPYSLGKAYAGMESPKARPWLLKAVAIDPKMAKAYSDLWIDGERWGDFKVAREYLKKAMETEPTSPDYAFYYRSGLKGSDPEGYRKGMYEMTQLFPTSERGAQSLYWLGLYVKDNKEKLAIYTQLKNQYPPEKFNWSSSGMYDFYYLYLHTTPEKAIELAQYMATVSTREGDKKSWSGRVKLAQDLIQVKSLMAQNKYTEAQTAVESITLERRSAATDMINLLKAELCDITGNTAVAYKKLVYSYAAAPADDIYEAMEKYGKKLGKDKNELFADIWKIRDSVSVPATPFSLGQYFKEGKASLADFKGKVILLTYWFPGCGPCRGEFPNFENVVRKFTKEQLVYIGINIAAEQDEYVVPFMKSSGYSFIPLKDEEEKRGNLVAPGAPTNYLLDQNGRIIFKNFRTDSNNERVLESMIEEILDRGKAAQNESNFEIKFNIKGVNPKNVYVTFFGEEDVATNEPVVINKGEFVLKGKTSVPVVARLSFSGEDRFLKKVGNGYIPYKCASLWMIVYPRAVFTVDGSLEGKDFIDIYPLDGGENNTFAELNKKMMPLTNSLGNATVELRINTTLDDNQKKELEKMGEEYNKEIDNVKREFLARNSNSLAALWLMEDMLIRSEIKPEELVPFMQKVDVKKYGSNYFYRAVKDRIDGSFASAVGKQCPQIITDATPDGSTFNIESMRGKFLIVDFWGTWCGPCVAGIPNMKAFQKKHADKLNILGISNDRSMDMWKAFLIKNEMTYQNILTGKGDKDFVSKFNVQGFPTKILISPQGKILYRDSGENEEFYSKIEEFISK